MCVCVQQLFKICLQWKQLAWVYVTIKCPAQYNTHCLCITQSHFISMVTPGLWLSHTWVTTVMAAWFVVMSQPQLWLGDWVKFDLHENQVKLPVI